MRARIIARIESAGPMPFDEYMEMCLYDPDDGFFAAGPVRSGKKGDFVTSPEISWAFGVPVGEWVDANVPSTNAVLVEVGAGSGSLFGEVADLWFAGDHGVFAIERSAAARRLLAKRYPDAAVVESLDEIPSGNGAVIVANEVLDNMPAALAKSTDDGWVEIAVGHEADELSLVEIPARDDVARWCDETFGDVHSGTTVSAQLAVAAWIDRVLDHFGTVTMCLIDYGGTSEELTAKHPSSIVRTYRSHQDSVDWLQHPGESDITVDVNITGVLKAIARAGRRARLMNQRDFCLGYGLGELIEDTAYREQLSASTGAIMDQLENRSERLDMEALIDPTGLGAFKVILVE